jgi:hypothetical protein
LDRSVVGAERKEKGEGNKRFNQDFGRRGIRGKGKGNNRISTKKLGEGGAGKGRKTKEARELKHVGIGNRGGSTIQEAGRRERVKEYRRVSEQRFGKVSRG